MKNKLRSKQSSEDSLLSIPQVAEKLSIHVRTVYRYIHSGILPKPVKIGGSSRFIASSINELIERLKKGGN